jgi:hypothetical protein
MRQDSRATKPVLRRALVASVVLHALAAGAFVMLFRAGDDHKRPRGIDTHAGDAPQVRMSLVDESPISLAAAPTPATPQAAGVPGTPLPAKPFAPSPPRTLPPELIAMIRRPAPQPTGAPFANSPTATDPNVKPAGGMTASAAGTVTHAMHGALKPGQTAVYVLDCSGSMGAAGKFEAARAALIATLRQQPPAVRFQVIVYAGSAVPLLASGKQGLPATEANVRAAAEKLATLEPRGRSKHAEAVRAALAFRPDVVLILTDADDLAPAALKRLLSAEGRPVPVCVARVTAAGVERPREVK